MEKSELIHLARSFQEFTDECKLEDARHKTFTNWPYDSDPKATLTSSKLSQCGFTMSTVDESEPSAECVWCSKDVVFDPTDDPLSEECHRNGCPMFKYRKPEKQWSVQEMFAAVTFKKSVAAVISMVSEHRKVLENTEDETQKRIHDLLIKANRAC
ncbi:unnamed protein product [Bursaphelenchus xylophilus]|uniref:(pine wood nematode) hypothetical protein n=1 Tax=Bursaphelenchus xylophilus TaxID=6326 RepID=A0A1I7RI59_BURXY|nr:unnamed protein product [Bursaphelenchus xylophilus]CAG9115137.1 unnamed protein product [Bursaphelenchus xylophilus]